MYKVTSTQAKTNFGDVLLNAMKAPVIINRHSKDIAVVISTEEFKRFKEFLKMEDEILGKMAEKAVNSGKYIGMKKSKELVDDILSS